MASTTTDSPLTIMVADRADMERQINEAVAVKRAKAMDEGRRGILVTRHSHNSFTVALSDTVPYGLTCESKDW